MNLNLLRPPVVFLWITALQTESNELKPVAPSCGVLWITALQTESNELKPVAPSCGVLVNYSAANWEFKCVSPSCGDLCELQCYKSSLFVLYIYIFINALLSTTSMYNAISHCITKNISHASTTRNKEKEGKRRGYISISLQIYRLLYIFYTSIGYKSSLFNLSDQTKISG